MKFSGAVLLALKLWVGSFLTGTKVDVTIKKHTNNRTNRQNAYYFGVVIVILADFFGYETTEMMHEEMKRIHNPVKSKINKSVIIGGSTAKMTTEEFFSDETSFVNRVRMWAASEYGVNIPDPEKVET